MGNKANKIKKNIAKSKFEYWPSEILFTPSEDVDIENDLSRRYLEDLMRKANQAMSGVAVAAPQVGWLKRMFYYNFPGGNSGIVYNPRIVKYSDEYVPFNEGCLSIPGYHWRVYRPAWIQVLHFDEYGSEFFRTLDGLAARVFQHEIDHLDGITLPDYMSEDENAEFSEAFFAGETSTTTKDIYADVNVRGTIAEGILA